MYVSERHKRSLRLTYTIYIAYGRYSPVQPTYTHTLFMNNSTSIYIFNENDIVLGISDMSLSSNTPTVVVYEELSFLMKISV